MASRPEPSPLRARLRRDLTAAMKRRDRPAVAALRSTLGAIDNAEAVPAPDGAPVGDGPIAGAVLGVGAGDAPRRDLTESMVTAIVVAEVSGRQAALAEYRRLGRDEHAAQLQAEITALLTYVEDPGDEAPAGPGAAGQPPAGGAGA